MTIDDILYPSRKPSISVEAVAALGGMIQEMGEVPSGHLYAAVMGTFDIDTYQRIIAMFKRVGLVKEECHLLTWIGPTFPKA